MAEISIGDATYQSFASEAFADTYIAADPLMAAPWAALDQDDRNRLSVAATRVLKRQPWLDGVPPFDDTPLVVQEATSEFAAAILAGYDLGTPAASILQVRRQKAGSVEVEYFADLDNPAYKPPPLPQAVWDMIKSKLVAPASGVGLASSIGFGTTGRSIAESPCDPNRLDYGFGSGLRDWD